jgi:hypothetical protein
MNDVNHQTDTFSQHALSLNELNETNTGLVPVKSTLHSAVLIILKTAGSITNFIQNKQPTINVIYDNSRFNQIDIIVNLP